MKVLLGCVLIAMLLAGTAAARDLTDDEKARIIAAVSAQLRDPDSAKFKFPDYDEADAPIYCGWVNAKNAFGGYVGDMPFQVGIAPVAGGRVDVIGIGNGDPDNAMTRALMVMCGF